MIVQELVAFVRKRDPRVKAHRLILDEKRQESQQKARDHKRRQIQKQLQFVNNWPIS